MGQRFQAKYVACCTVGGQVRNDAGIVHGPGHDFQAIEQSLVVQKVLHPQGVDDGLRVIRGVVEGQLTFVGGKELQQQVTHCPVGIKCAVVWCIEDFQVVAGKRNTVVLIPGESNGANSCFVKTQREGFNVTGKAWVLVQLLEGYLDGYVAFWVLR